MKMNRGFAPVMWLLVAILLVSAAVAQETTAGLQGTIKDPQGLVVSKATVEVSGPALIGAKKVETDSSGYYRFANLPPGDYVVTVTAQGFRTHKQSGLRLEVGKLPTLDLKMEVGGVEQTVEVSGEAPIVDVSSSKVSTTVSSNIIDGIPKGRSFQSVINFAPGARQEPLQSTNRGATGFSVDGASDGENSYLVEGMDTTDAYAGGIGRTVPFEFVQEVQIKTSGFEAEHGGALGGVVNVVQKRGGNAWHGSAFVHWRTDALNARDNCGNMTAVISVNCGLRNFASADPTAPGQTNVTATRTGATPEYYQFKKDHQRIIDPGFEVGGYLKKDRLWLFTSYVPTLDRLTRTVNFNFTGTGGPKVGPRSYNQRIDTHNALTRLDWLATNKIRLYGAWQYGYQRQSGTNLPTPDSVAGQFNSTSLNDPDAFRQEYGSVLPNSVYTFGGDLTLTDKFVVTARYGYWFNNLRNVGRPTGVRYLNAGATPLVVGGNTLYSASYQNMSSNFQTLFDAFKRKGFSTDASYFTKGFMGTHNFKFGYALNRIQNDILAQYNQSLVELFFGQNYDVLNPGACAAVEAAHGGNCTGDYGYYIVSDFRNRGAVASNNHALYAQDAWTLGGGVTLNVGIRFDKEYLPPYTDGAPDISFNFTDKIAPRIGGAWDVMQNGKLKVYGSFGWFYDIMKYSLPRGSFGGDYWHDCVYTLDVTTFGGIVPTGCPVSGGAAGAVNGTFIENVNYRSVTLDPNDPGVDPDLKPMRQTEISFGADYALTPTIGFEARYTHKDLDRTIEDVGIPVPGNELYYIGNPGEGIVANLLQRPVTDSSGLPYSPAVTYPITCATCPLSPKAKRVYDGVEFRLTKRASERWFGSVSYTYSKLRGNYSGLTSSDASDASSAAVGAGGGRHNPNVSRAFDLPFMTWDSHGKEIDGPLGTDRPHTLKLFGWYRMKWFGQETMLGISQQAYSGTPLSTCIGLFSTSSSCQFVEGRGNFVELSREADGDLVRGNIINGYRTPRFTQTDLNFNHEFKVSKTNEGMRLGFESSIQNLFNQRAVLSKQMNPFVSTQVISTSYTDAGGNPALGPSWTAVTNGGWDYIPEANAQRRIFNNHYNLPNLFQTARQVRLKVKFVF